MAISTRMGSRVLVLEQPTAHRIEPVGERQGQGDGQQPARQRVDREIGAGEELHQETAHIHQVLASRKISTRAAKAKPNPYRPISMGRLASRAASAFPVGWKPKISPATRIMPSEVSGVTSRLVKVRPTSSSGRGSGHQPVRFQHAGVHVAFQRVAHAPEHRRDEVAQGRAQR